MAEWLYVYYLKCPFCYVWLERTDMFKTLACACGMFEWEGKTFTYLRKRRLETAK